MKKREVLLITITIIFLVMAILDLIFGNGFFGLMFLGISLLLSGVISRAGRDQKAYDIALMPKHP